MIEKLEEIQALLAELVEKGAFVDPHTTVDVEDTTVRKVASLGDAKSLIPGAGQVEELAKAAGLQWSEGLETRAIPYWASTEQVDHHGDIVRQSWDLSIFNTNPVMPFSHEWEKAPIGAWIETETRDKAGQDYNGPALYALGLFAPDDPTAESVYRLAASGFLRGVSVGFRPLKVADIQDKDERAELGLGPFGLVLEHNQLLEISPTTIGANPGALSILRSAKSDNGLQARDLLAARELFRRDARRVKSGADQWVESDEKLVQSGRLLFPDVEFQAHEDIEAPIEPEERPLKGYVRGASVEQDATTAAIERLTATVEESILSLSRRLDDVRDAVEQLSENEPRRVGEEQSESTVDDGENEGLKALLEKLDKQLHSGMSEQ